MKILSVATTINPRFDHVTPIESTRSDVTITHRCHVIAELIAVARSGLVDMVLVANDLELVNLEALQQLADADGYGPRIAAISDVTEDRQRLTELGIPVASPHLSGHELVQWLQEVHSQETVPAQASSELTADELQFLEQMDPEHKPPATTEAVDKFASTSRPGRRAAPYDPTTDIPPDDVQAQALGHEPPTHDKLEVDDEPEIQPDEEPIERPPLGHVTAVWGPTGSPGVTTVAVNMAVESAIAGHRTLLIDADTYGAAVAVHLGLLDDTAAIAQVCRAAEHRGIDAAGLAGFAQKVRVHGTQLDVITGLTRAERWPQLRSAAWAQVLDAARSGWDQIFIDCGFSLEQDEELSFDIPAPQRNATTITAVTTANTVIAVGTGDPVGFVRYMKGLERLTEITRSSIVPVINKVASMTSGVSPKHQLSGVWERFGPSLVLRHFLPWAPDVTAAALLGGKTLVETAPKAELRKTIQKIMHTCVPAPVPTAANSTSETTDSAGTKLGLRGVLGNVKHRMVKRHREQIRQ